MNIYKERRGQETKKKFFYFGLGFFALERVCLDTAPASESVVRIGELGAFEGLSTSVSDDLRLLVRWGRMGLFDTSRGGELV